ncbi:nuclear transport factor 2 family protein [Usitatibacter palustris]|uniref:DUF4440 domain-containing protein n=1 Tax=Usitatibacter palustris TaxID=2732487 RepID=A0A6M4H1Y3_9PROT|nr:DUF4440 domain-containing protein [Usitatibacter palustris]QJR13529.1 hypothetical protein DSM104440_00313 [Usitatibacter palustris]
MRLLRVVLLSLAFSLTSQSLLAADVAAAIAALESRLEKGLAARDASALEPLLAEPFTWVHSSDGRIDSRETWLATAARGIALAGQRDARTEHGSSLAVYGGNEPHTAVRVSRVRLVDAAGAKETWLRQTRVYVRGSDGGWRLAVGQGVAMYQGPLLDAALHARYAGTYAIDPGRSLTLKWQDGALLATFPSGAETQIFLASPTEEAVRAEGIGKLRFTLDAQGQPTHAALVRNDKELWRGTRSKP